MKTHSTKLTTADGPMAVHWAEPDAEEFRPPYPAVIVYQEAFGVNRHIRSVCARLAGAGYLAAAPELFHRHSAGLEIDYADFAKALPVLQELTTDRLLMDATAVRAFLAEHPQVDARRLAALGFCLGGFTSVLTACHLPLAAAVSFYGGGLVRRREGFGFGNLLDELARAGCPLLLIYGSKDSSIPPADIEAVRDRLNAARKPHEIEIYREAPHGFFCEDRSAYQPGAAQTAWYRTLHWLEEQLDQTLR
jgi:carboxymethylenebutenolidase